MDHNFLSKFLEAQIAHPEIVDEPTLISYVVTDLVAGSDTIAVAFSSIIYRVLKHNLVHQKLQAELDGSSIRYPAPFKVTHSLPYLDAVIREFSRMHFVSSMLFECVVLEEGLQLSDGRRLPAGTIVGINGWTIHFDKEVFGTDTEPFNSDRWL